MIKTLMVLHVLFLEILENIDTSNAKLASTLARFINKIFEIQRDSKKILQLIAITTAIRLSDGLDWANETHPLPFSPLRAQHQRGS